MCLLFEFTLLQLLCQYFKQQSSSLRAPTRNLRASEEYEIADQVRNDGGEDDCLMRNSVSSWNLYLILSPLNDIILIDYTERGFFVMKVILLQDIKNVGQKGQLLDAADGYARNYLIPRKMAVEATKGNVKELESKNKALVAKAEKEIENAKEFAASIEQKKIDIQVKMGTSGKLFGSVTNKEIAQALLEQTGVSIDKKKVILSEPIKSVGEKEVEIKVMHDISAKIIVNVTGA